MITREQVIVVHALRSRVGEMPERTSTRRAIEKR
jgi:hypothetical protein